MSALDANGPIFGDLFLGAGAVYLALLGADLVPLCSWMGGKRREASIILRTLGLRPGRMFLGARVGEQLPCLLGDASWWGWVWPVVLDPVEGPRVSGVLRSWRGEDPRALWFRLRDLGPITDDVAAAAAQLLWLQARAASGVPVWWEGAGTWALGVEGWRYADNASSGGGLVQERGWKSPTCSTHKLFPATQGNADEVREDRRERRAPLPGSGADVDQLTADIALAKWDRTRRGHQGPANQTHAEEPRLVKTNTGGDKIEDGCCKGNNARGAGGIVDPGTIAARADAIRGRLGAGGHRVGEATVLNADARTVTEEWAARIGARGRIYLDPPYQGKTGYPASCPRSDVLWIAEEWARHGARVVLSEAVGLAEELGAGWREEQLREGEWITCYGCEAVGVSAAGAA